MKAFFKGINDDLQSKLQAIEMKESNILDKASQAIMLLENAFDELKAYISGYSFESEDEEIHFFKKSKPNLFSKLIYYTKIYNIEAMRPNGQDCAQRNYFAGELDQLEVFFNKNIDFYKYYRSGSTYLDRYYFLRGKHDIQLTVESFYFERDPQFSTNCDFKVAKILANELLRIYLNEELLRLEKPVLTQEPISFPKSKETWTGSKTDLVELIYAFCEVNSFNFGKISRKRLTDYFENVFNVDLGDVYHTYLAIRGRINRTQFLDELKAKLTAKMEKDDQK